MAPLIEVWLEYEPPRSLVGVPPAYELLDTEPQLSWVGVAAADASFIANESIGLVWSGPGDELPSFSLRRLYGEKGRLYDGDMADESTEGVRSTGLTLGESTRWTWLGCSVTGDVAGGAIADKSTGFSSSFTGDGDGSAC